MVRWLSQSSTDRDVQPAAIFLPCSVLLIGAWGQLGPWSLEARLEARLEGMLEARLEARLEEVEELEVGL